jgi:hypothetical protein
MRHPRAVVAAPVAADRERRHENHSLWFRQPANTSAGPRMYCIQVAQRSTRTTPRTNSTASTSLPAGRAGAGSPAAWERGRRGRSASCSGQGGHTHPRRPLPSAATCHAALATVHRARSPDVAQRSLEHGREVVHVPAGPQRRSGPMRVRSGVRRREKTTGAPRGVHKAVRSIHGTSRLPSPSHVTLCLRAARRFCCSGSSGG